MAEEIFYRGYKIIAQSYKIEGGKWVPQARIIPVSEEADVEGEGESPSAHDDESAGTEESPLTWPETFNTQLEADDFALDSAQFYIDEDINT
ncbi:MAG: hypothetical protein PHW72_01795 [Candidatus Pacebacteria bacterium]|nr:hypothetical protein [Candidatus Paceibacterota bacterium]